MTSPYGCILAPMIVPTGGWAFDWVASSGTSIITIPAGSYASMVEFCAAWQTALRALGAGPPDHRADTVSFLQTGRITLYIVAATDTAFATCADDLLTVAGFDETETFSAAYITANDQMSYAWFPGQISFGTSSGAGLSADSGWLVTDEALAVVAGSGTARIIAPARRRYTRTLRFGPIKREEALLARNTGPAALMDRWATGVLRWYPDRDHNGGVSFTAGTQLDPGPSYYEIDSDGDYYAVTLTDAPTITPISNHPDWFDVTLKFNAEPK